MKTLKRIVLKGLQSLLLHLIRNKLLPLLTNLRKRVTNWSMGSSNTSFLLDVNTGLILFLFYNVSVIVIF